MVFEIHPASEMADSIENVYTKGEWLEEYDIMAPTGQNLFVGPKYAFKYEETKSGDKNVIVGESYPAYFYNSNDEVLRMNTNGFSGNNGSSVIGDWKQKQSYQPTTTTSYVCNKTYFETDEDGNTLKGNEGDTTTEVPDAAVAQFWTQKVTITNTVDYEKIDIFNAEGPGWIWLENGQKSSLDPAIISGQYVNIDSKSQPNTTTYQLIYALGENTCTTTYSKTECTTTEIDYSYNSENGWQQTGKPKETVKILKESFQTTNTESENKIYKIAQFKIQYFDKNIVGPISQKMGDFVNNMEIIAEQGNGNTKDITTSTWTYATNALDRQITAGFGWALGLMTTSSVKDPVIRLPKNDTVYHYFRNDTWVGESVRIDRTEDLGRPMLELDKKTDNMVIRLENYESSKYFLFGNPTFASIDLERLLAANPSIKAFYQITVDKDNRYLLASTQDTTSSRWYTNLTKANTVKGTLPTGEACFIVLNEPAKTVDIKLNPAMLRNSNTNDKTKMYDGYGNPWGTTYSQSSSSAAPAAYAAYADTIAIEPSAIYITATLDSFMCSTSIIDAPDAEQELFMLDREKTPFAIYTVADSKALSINHIREGQSRIPLAMYAEKPVNQPLFAFEGEARYLVEWDLVDINTGVRQPLYEGLTMRLNMPQDGSVRYYLERSRHGIYTSESKTDAFQTYAYGGMLTIYSEEPLYDLRIYDPAGRLLCMEADAGTSYTANLTAGTYIIRASGSTCKVIVP